MTKRINRIILAFLIAAYGSFLAMGFDTNYTVKLEPNDYQITYLKGDAKINWDMIKLKIELGRYKDLVKSYEKSYDDCINMIQVPSAQTEPTESYLTVEEILDAANTPSDYEFGATYVYEIIMYSVREIPAYEDGGVQVSTTDIYKDDSRTEMGRVKIPVKTGQEASVLLSKYLDKKGLKSVNFGYIDELYSITTAKRK